MYTSIPTCIVFAFFTPFTFRRPCSGRVLVVLPGWQDLRISSDKNRWLISLIPKWRKKNTMSSAQTWENRKIFRWFTNWIQNVGKYVLSLGSILQNNRIISQSASNIKNRSMYCWAGNRKLFIFCMLSKIRTEIIFLFSSGPGGVHLLHTPVPRHFERRVQIHDIFVSTKAVHQVKRCFNICFLPSPLP